MILGIGVDLISFREIKSKDKLANHILSLEELSLYESFTSEARKLSFLAGRFAVKEAIIKALSGHFEIKNLKDLIVLNDEAGKPYLKNQFQGASIKLSISHNKTDALGFAILQSEPDLL